MKSKLFFVVALITVLFISAPAPCQDEQITLSTYYPAPYGEYDELCAEKLLVDTPSAQELQDMQEGDCHITRSLIVGSGAGTGFSYDELAPFNLPGDGDVLIRGNVGIGTPEPSYKVHVEGSDDVALLVRTTTSNTGRARVRVEGVETNPGFPTIGGALHWDENGSYLGLVTYNGVRPLVLQESGGNVGIGTIAPEAPLDIKRPAATTMLKMTGIKANSGGSARSESLDLVRYNDTYLDVAAIRLNLNTYFDSSGDLSFWTRINNTAGNYTEKVRITNTGNVGIGTTNPGAPLTIKADDSTTMALQLIDRDTNEVASISWFSTGLTEEARINNYQSNLRFYTGSPIAESMRITASGNVGIGTTTPGAWKLFVNNEGGTALLCLRTSYDGGRSLQIGYDDPLNYWAFNTDATGGFRFNGNVSKQSGGFDIPHPIPVKEKEDWRLKHSFVESPTRGDNLYRWTVEVKDGEVTIELPDYFRYLNENVQVWVSPKRHFGRACGETDTELTKIVVKADSDGAYNVLAVGTRKDRYAKGWFDKLGVEYQAIAKE